MDAMTTQHATVAPDHSGPPARTLAYPDPATQAAAGLAGPGHTKPWGRAVGGVLY